MAKLYEIILKKIRNLFVDNEKELSKKKESKKLDYFNPLKLSVGQHVVIDAIDYRDLNLKVDKILCYVLHIGKRSENTIVDYVLSGEDQNFRLRVFEAPSGLLKAVILNKYDEFAYSHDFKQNVLEDKEKKFVIDDTLGTEDESDDIHEEFWRINDIGTQIVCSVLQLTVNDRGEIIEQDLGIVDFWDYSRLCSIDGVEIEELLIVEINREDGWTEIWRGISVLTEKISAF